MHVMMATLMNLVTDPSLTRHGFGQRFKRSGGSVSVSGDAPQVLAEYMQRCDLVESGMPRCRPFTQPNVFLVRTRTHMHT